MPDLTALARQFGRLIELVTGRSPASGRPEDVALDLLERWTQPRRRYHDVAHLQATLGAVRQVLPDGVVPEVELAVWFHDAVYDGRPGDDEEAGAQLAEAVLTDLGVPPDAVAEVARLVRLTAGHEPAPDDVPGQVLCDADLAVLGADAVTYLTYARAVRQEYASVPEPDYRAGRAAVLRRLVDRPAVYRTPRGRQLWEAAARANVGAELARLADPLTPLAGEEPV